MSFILHRGKVKTMYFKGDTALQVRDGGLVVLTDSGTLSPIRNDSDDKIIGNIVSITIHGDENVSYDVAVFDGVERKCMTVWDWEVEPISIQNGMLKVIGFHK